MSQSNPFDVTDTDPEADQYDQYKGHTRPRRRTIPASSLATLSFVLGAISIAGCGVLLGPIAIFLGGLALATKKENQDGNSAFAGIITGVVGLVVGAILFVMVLNGFRPH